MKARAPAAAADVTLLLEGTYPYVSGGVSSWVHQILLGLPELRFSLVFIGGAPGQHGAARYELPENVVHLEHHYLAAPGPAPRRRRRAPAALFRESQRLHDYLRAPGAAPPPSLPELLGRLGAPGGLQQGDFLHDEAAWRQICDSYRAHSREPSFLDYFWAVRAMHSPLFPLAALAERLPPSGVYHAVSTGYAGFLGALLRHRTGRPFLLTEHGIYTRERRLELLQADWIRESRQGAAAELGYLRELWTRFYDGLSRLAYGAADRVITLFEGNRRRQIEGGAPAERTCVVPNGVALARFAPLRRERPLPPPPVLGFLGRVVPVKDVKTFLRALRHVCDRLPEAEGWIIGPLDEDPTYAAECRTLAGELGLGDRARFLGLRRPEEVLPRLGVLVLTSVSEALPLVLLEGFASGIPAVATDVGACRELIEGRDAADRALGSAGAVVPLGAPEATADAALSLLCDRSRFRAAQEAAGQRVTRFYSEAGMLQSYRALYQGALAAAPAPRAGEG